MKFIGLVLKDIWSKIKQSFLNILNEGLKKNYEDHRWWKTLLDGSLILGWIYAVIFYPSSMVVGILGVTMVVIILTRILMPSGSGILHDLGTPFITLVLFSLGTAIFFFAREVSILVGLLMIPVATREAELKCRSYYDELTPETQVA